MMRKNLVYLTAVAVTSLWGCQKDSTATNQKLDQIIEGQKQILEELKKGGGARAAAARPRRPQRPRPNPKSVYSVPVDDAAYKGAEHAKITVVEAFEFA